MTTQLIRHTRILSSILCFFSLLYTSPVHGQTVYNETLNIKYSYLEMSHNYGISSTGKFRIILDADRTLGYSYYTDSEFSINSKGTLAGYYGQVPNVSRPRYFHIKASPIHSALSTFGTNLRLSNGHGLRLDKGRIRMEGGKIQSLNSSPFLSMALSAKVLPQNGKRYSYWFTRKHGRLSDSSMLAFDSQGKADVFLPVLLNSGLHLKGGKIEAPNKFLMFKSGTVRSKGNRYDFLDPSGATFLGFYPREKNVSITGGTLKVLGNLILDPDSRDRVKIDNHGHLRFKMNTSYASFRIHVSQHGDALYASADGKVGIGRASDTSTLSVAGNIKAANYKTDAQTFPDYVFEPAYPLPTLEEVETFLQAHKHLPGIPSEKEVIKSGLDVKHILIQSVEKIEELTLYKIELDKQIKAKQETIDQQEKQIHALEKMVKQLSALSPAL